ncbi:Uncharacterized mitochondrial protein AtMg00310 [Linum grandiflorum]
MRCFLIPKENIERFHSKLADFWWGQNRDEKRLHWITWTALCLPKVEGGLGFRNFQAFNQALLARQSWRLLHNPNLLLARLYSARYHSTTSLLTGELGYRPSWGWRSILHGRDLLLQGLRWQVSDGRLINALNDKWLPLPIPRPPQLLDILNHEPCSIVSLTLFTMDNGICTF